MITINEINEVVDSHREEALDFLQECIRTPSVTGNERQMGEVIKKWLGKTGLEVKCYEKAEGRPNLIAEWRGSNPGKRFVFNGHMDVFPPVAGNNGLYGPWSGKVVDGYIYGRGTVDMKSGLCASILAVKYLKELGYDPTGSILLTAVSDEENSAEYGTKYLLKEGLIQGDFGIDPEPTRSKVLIKHCGGMTIRVTYHSLSGHTSMPHPTIDALTKSIKAIQKLYDLNKEIMKNYDEEMGVCSLLSVTMLNSGNTSNMYPSESSFVIDRRLLPGEDIATEHERIKAALDSLKVENPTLDYSYDYDVTGEFPCLLVDENERIVLAALKAYKDITGKETTIYKRGGSSDAGDICVTGGFPIPNFGAGNDVEESTSENEHLPLEEYYTFIKVYMQTVINALG